MDPKGRPVRKRSGPGRPEGQSVTRSQILDAAEARFAELGYAGASLRDIAHEAGVTQALLNYYFGSKESLFVEVYLRRGKVLAARRLEGLRALQASGRRYKVEDVVRAFLEPALEIRASAGGKRFIRLQSRVHIEPSDFAYALRRQVYDESTHAYVEELRRVLPHLDEQTVYWRLVQFIGGYLYLISDSHRLGELSHGLCDPDDSEQFMANAVAFAVGALTAKPPLAAVRNEPVPIRRASRR